MRRNRKLSKTPSTSQSLILPNDSTTRLSSITESNSLITPPLSITPTSSSSLQTSSTKSSKNSNLFSFLRCTVICATISVVIIISAYCTYNKVGTPWFPVKVKIGNLFEAAFGDTDTDDITSSNEKIATVDVNSHLNVRSFPSTNSKILTKLDDGALVIILEELDDNWCKVYCQLDDAYVEGYVNRAYLKYSK